MLPTSWLSRLTFRLRFVRTAFFVLLVSGLAVAASGTLTFPASLKTWSAEVTGLPVVYHFVDLSGWDALAYARAEWPTRRCHIYLDVWLFNSPSELVNLTLHEVGHCVDILDLDFDHNGLGWGDCTNNSHDCRPEERYAEAWREAYLSACGTSLYPVGFVDEAEHICALPDPRSVTTGVRTTAQARPEGLQDVANGFVK